MIIKQNLLFISLLISIVCLSLNELSCIPIMAKHLQDLKRHTNYPLYELSDEQKMSRSEEDEFIQSRSKDQRVTFHNARLSKFDRGQYRRNESGYEVPVVSLISRNGSISWTIDSENINGARRGFFPSYNDIVVVSKYENNNSVSWIDKTFTILNTLQLKDNQVAKAYHLEESGNWLLETFYSSFDELPNDSKDYSSLIFTDSHGNVLNRIELGDSEYYDKISISNSGHRIMYSVINSGNMNQKYTSYFLTSRGSIINQYDNMILSRGFFSDDDNVYIAYAGFSKIVDVNTGDIITSYRSTGPSKPANLGTNVFVVMEQTEFKIVNYQTHKILFQKNFKHMEGIKDIKYIDISGDGSEVTVIIDKTKYIYNFTNRR